MRILITMLLGTLVIGGTVYVVAEYQPEQQQRVARMRADTAVPVLAATTNTADVPVHLDAVGTTRALNTVTVRPQVDGKLTSIGFREGQDVSKGDILARLDPTIHQAQLEQALAKKAQSEALLENARRDLDRYLRLAASNVVAQKQEDTQRAQVAQLDAQVRLDQAAIDNARAVLAYTTIRAPISGRTGIRMVDEGNIVRASDSAGIVVITQIQPISVLFNVPQQRLTELHTAVARGPVPVEVLGPDRRTAIERGTLAVIDNHVDQATGTVRIKADFPNADLKLWPGQFVNVRVLIDTLRDSVVVPTAAVQRGPNGTFVFVVRPDETVSVRPVSVAQQDDEQAVIAGGLEAGQRVVTTGFAQLAEGRQVRISDGSAPPVMRPPGRERPPGARQPERRPEALRRDGDPPTERARGERRREQRSEARPNPAP